MSLRPGGLYCDACDDPMLMAMVMGGDQGWFNLSITTSNLNACEKCKPKITKDMKSTDFNESPLRRLLEKYEN